MPLFDILGPIVSKVLDFIPDASKKAEAQLALQKELDSNQQAILSAVTALNKGQTDIDVEEAKSGSLFDKWRDAIGWTCAAAFAWQYVLQPLVVFTLTETHHVVNLPSVDFSTVSNLTTAMLGLAGMHMYQNVQNGDK